MSKIKKRKGWVFPVAEPGYTYLNYDELAIFDPTIKVKWDALIRKYITKYSENNWEISENNWEIIEPKKKKSYQPDWL